MLKSKDIRCFARFRLVGKGKTIYVKLTSQMAKKEKPKKMCLVPLTGEEEVDIVPRKRL